MMKAFVLFKYVHLKMLYFTRTLLLAQDNCVDFISEIWCLRQDRLFKKDFHANVIHGHKVTSRRANTAATGTQPHVLGGRVHILYV